MSDFFKKPPAIAKFLLSLFLNHSHPDEMLGDYDEIYFYFLKEKGFIFSRLWYWMQIILIIPSFFKNSIYWSAIMFQNYFKIAYRNIIKHKTHSFINITGLAIGIASCIIIMFWVQNELSFDKFHENSDRIFRVICKTNNPEGVSLSTRTPMALAETLKNEFPEIVKTTRGMLMSGWLIKHEDKGFTNDLIGFADEEIFDIFTHKFINGDPHSALKDKYSIILTEKMALKYFGNENPVGRTISLLNRDITVSAVIENHPHNSSRRFDCLLSFQFFGELGVDIKSWGKSYGQTYILLRSDSHINEVNNKIAGTIQNYLPESNSTLFLQPFTDMHLHNVQGGGDIKYIYIFSSIAFFILLIACINFMNLSTAKSVSRIKEIGIRKVMGSGRKGLIKQFLGESLLLSAISMAIALIIMNFTLPAFNTFLQKQININFTDNIMVIPILIAVTIITGLISGSYPALYLSSFNPTKTLKGTFNTTKKSAWFRKTLVIVQFSLSIFLIIGALVISNQLDFMVNKDLGFNKKHQISFSAMKIFRNNFNSVKEELIQHPGIKNVSQSSSLPGYIEPGTTDINWQGKNPDTEISMHPFPVNYNFIETMNMEIIAGRSFSDKIASDSSAFILNETAVKAISLNRQSAIGINFTMNGTNGKIIGVVQDFHHSPLNEEIKPLVLNREDGFIICASLDPDHYNSALNHIKSVWDKHITDYPFEVDYLEQNLNEFYQTEKMMGAIINIFTFLAILISCLGLFGLSSFITEQKTKEIGIRKVIGASVSSIIVLLSKDFIKWIIISNIISAPIAYFSMNIWLDNFAYKISLEFWIFILAGGLTLTTALITVLIQALKAATSNPVNALKYE